MTAKSIMRNANSIRIVGAGDADIYDYMALSRAWYVFGDRIDTRYVEAAVERALRDCRCRVFRHCDDSGYVTITIIANIGEGC